MTEEDRSAAALASKEWRRKNPAKFRAVNRNACLKSAFGITADDYDMLLSNQGGVCAVCARPETGKSRYGGVKRLAVDHCHVTKKVRGLLCEGCNRAIGLFKEDVASMASAIDYIRKHNAAAFSEEK